MDPEHKAAWVKRESQPYRGIRQAFVSKAEDLARALQGLNDVKVFQVLWTVFLDSGALYSVQVGTTKEEFMAWAAESYELYAAFIKESGIDSEKAHKLSEQLSKETNKP